MSADGHVLVEPALESRRTPSPDPAAGTPRVVPHDALAAPAEVVSRDRHQRRALALADALAALAAVLLATLPFGRPLPAAWLVAVPLAVLLAKLEGLYDRDELLLRKTTLDEAPCVLRVATLTALGLWLLGEQPSSRGALLVLGAMLCAAALVLRSLARTATARLLPAERCLFLGGAAEYERLRRRLRSRAVHAELVGRIALRPDGRGGAVAEPQAMGEMLAGTGVQRVVIEPQALPPEDLVDVVRAAKAAGVHVSLLPRMLDVVGTAVVFDDLEGVTVLGVRRFGLTRSSLLVKRAFDVAVASAVVVALAPLMALAGLAILLDSGRPILFRQIRVGRDGRPFSILKFRTMDPGAEARHHELRRRHGLDGELFKLQRDPRVTRVGRLLRRTSLDELPQLLNVLRGEMSLVGPRPLVVDEDAQITGFDRRRLHLTPGMTGTWQIASAGRVPLAEMVKIDYLYVAGWSLWLDVKILLRTIPHVVLRRGM